MRRLVDRLRVRTPEPSDVVPAHRLAGAPSTISLSSLLLGARVLMVQITHHHDFVLIRTQLGLRRGDWYRGHTIPT
jgi:hypothetical protein